MLFLGALLGEVVGLVRDHIKGRRDVAVAKAQAEVEIAKRKATAEIDWDMEFASQAKNSWRDEYITVLITVPIIAVFFPGYAPYIAEGFKTLETTVPDWYVTFAGAVVAAAFGIRSLKDVWLTSRKKKN